MGQDPLNLIVCGVGGQGNILIARLIGRVLASNGYFVNIGETFGAAQRGGSVFSSLRISKKREYGPLVSKGQGHVIIGLEPLETLRMLSLFGNPEIVALTNDREVYPVDVLGGRDKYPNKTKLMRTIELSTRKAWAIPATRIAFELAAPVVTNIAMLGAVIGANVLPLDTYQVKEEIKNSVPLAKVDLNLEAFARGMAVTGEKTTKVKQA